MAGEVSHKGRVLSITPEVTTVAIEQHSACSECHAAGLCTLSDVVEKAVEVPTRPFAAYNVGDEVEIVLKASMGFKAVWLAYFIPLVVLLAVILLLAWLGVGEVVAGLSGIGAVGVYYFFLWLFREKLRNEYTFTIK
ncbi:MAG: SoxR reducing system RseC family protein [Bacteroidales bacterium]|jgi:sigma-E factor negative regulatory protein RseC|nr:SoxR reducing system RseC family protein [Bacteroidales bacterium]MBQ9653162.1 SoxR reducing system RseC family protein [Bacteroidales bacterium]